LRRYDEALTWAKIILELEGPTLSAGAHEAPSLLFDMEKLFERWVEVHTRKTLDPAFLARRHGAARHLATIQGAGADQTSANGQAGGRASVFKLMPDVLVWAAETHDSDLARSSPEEIVDAKWKTINPSAKNWGVGEKDVYQMLAYATRFDCRQAVLAYPIFKGARNDALPEPPIFHIDRGFPLPITLSLRLIPIDH
jgi:5-methylcytosine-specific restriction enzyme subunit McrC